MRKGIVRKLPRMPGQRGRLFEDHMGIGAAKAKAADPGAQGQIGRSGHPVNQRAVDGDASLIEFEDRAHLFAVQGGR